MKTKIGIFILVSSFIFSSYSCSDDKEGAKFTITIEQSGDYLNYEREMILSAVGGLYDNIHDEEIKISISTNEKVNLFIATLYVNGVKEGVTDPGTMSWEIKVYREELLVYEEIKEYNPEMKFPQAVSISRD